MLPTLPAVLLGSPIHAAGTVNVAASTATPNFPQNIAFHLEASAPGSEITAVSLLYHPTGTPAWKRVNLPADRGTSVKLDYTLDTQVYFLPPGIDIEYRWLLALADGSTSRTPSATFIYMDGRVQWKKIQSGSVTLWWYSGNDAFAKDAADTAARSVDKAKKLFSVSGDRPMRIFLYPNARDMRPALPPNSAPWLGSMATPELGVVEATIDPATSVGQASSAAEVRRVIPHEISRLLAYQASENPYNTLPTWLDEGLATIEQETPDLRLRPLLFDAVTNGTLIPIRALNSPFPLDPNRALLSYAESESIANYIIGAYKPGTIALLLAAFKGGVSPDEAAQQVFKESLEEFEKDWKASLNYGGDQGGITG